MKMGKEVLEFEREEKVGCSVLEGCKSEWTREVQEILGLH